MPLGDYVSIVRRTAYNRPNERLRYAVLKGYFDGSGKSDNPTTQAVTLAGLTAQESVWPEFEDKWGAALRELGLSTWHTVARHYHDTQARFWAAATALLRVIETFQQRNAMATVAATVMLDGYRRAKLERPSLLTPEAMCVYFCKGNIVVPRGESILMVFDHDERFIDEIKPDYLERKRRFESEGVSDWSTQTVNMIEDHWQSVRPLQAADLIAWLVQRYEKIKRQPNALPNAHAEAMELALEAFFTSRYVSTVYDYESITKRLAEGTDA